jgi:peptide-methionine (R)-S-oxide reductase
MNDKTGKTDAEWRAELTPMQYNVARKKGTEPAFTGEYWNNHENGVYRCVCCGTELFSSAEKFDSGSGWPSYWKPMRDENVKTEPRCCARNATPTSGTSSRTARRPPDCATASTPPR